MLDWGVLVLPILGVWLIMVIAIVWVSMKIAISNDKDEYLDD